MLEDSKYSIFANVLCFIQCVCYASSIHTMCFRVKHWLQTLLCLFTRNLHRAPLMFNIKTLCVTVLSYQELHLSSSVRGYASPCLQPLHQANKSCTSFSNEPTETKPTPTLHPIPSKWANSMIPENCMPNIHINKHSTTFSTPPVGQCSCRHMHRSQKTTSGHYEAKEEAKT